VIRITGWMGSAETWACRLDGRSRRGTQTGPSWRPCTTSSPRSAASSFYELDQAIDDHKRQRWIESVLDLRTPPESEPVEMDSAVPTRTATPPPNGTPPRKSAFGAKSQPEPSNATPVDTAAAPTAPAPGRKSIFKAKSQPEPPAGNSADSTGGESDHELSTDEHLVEVDQQIQAVMSELPADELAEIASELGLSPEEVEAMVQEPDFAALVAEEQAQSGSSA
jgi:hypothetical protein